MTFSNQNTFTFSKSDEPKPIRDDFREKTIEFVVHDKPLPMGLVIDFKVSRMIRFDRSEAKTDSSVSRWRVLRDKFIHHNTGKSWEPDVLYNEIIHSIVLGLRDGEFFGETAEKVIMNLFDWLEVDTLGKDDSVFASEFPKFFNHRHKSLLKRRMKPIKKVLKS